MSSEHTPISSDVHPNKDLSGHTLLFALAWDLPEGYQDSLAERYPGLTVRHCRWDGWKTWQLPPADLFSGDDWKQVTILVPGPVVPTPDLAPNMQLVQLMSAGANLFTDKPLFTDTNVQFCTANGVHGPQIAEWVVCTYLNFQHSIPRYLKQQQEGKWQREYTLKTNDAVRQRVGILGYGSIGRQVARLCTAMGMIVHAYTSSRRTTPSSKHDRAYIEPGLGDPEGLLPSAWYSADASDEPQNGLSGFLSSGLDLLVICAPLTPATKGLLSLPQFQLLHEHPGASGGAGGAFISNIARGGLIDTSDLITALDRNWIRGAALDVTDPEPLPDGHPLWARKDVFITPHVSGESASYIRRLTAILDVNLARLSAGKGEWLNGVDKSRGY